ncbi:uracil-DNA glycosylase [Mesomycoplasma lagogenitalium]|uniref:Uracil-DNA glycosylase n=1 Tax=Mesomycoplasma lagogenitalium TaxID=171286 RepID=A0ABY8LY33_9BACT|nr:uracil-DNA glycosylase [Mesomycoplasma lagogenitalium]WGI37047.1 uracil-DNA glycosylase [Mesomycoplasma lagogenitalium]
MLSKKDIVDFLTSEKNKNYYIDLMNYLKKQKETKIIFPAVKDIYKSLKITDFQNLKLIIIGQDPYHGENEADGLAFSTQNSKLPPSLLNIYKEIKRDYPNFQKQDGKLDEWAKQGVLLLNRVLTVEKDKPNSHANQGWEIFTSNFLKFINQNYSNLIFLLLGKKAQSIINEIDLSKQIIINLSHPSPFSYHISFQNSHAFFKINQILKKLNKREIKW